MNDDDITKLLPLRGDQLVILWWAIYEKVLQLDCRLKQFDHINWPAEAKAPAKWERDRLKEVLTNLEGLK
jgi:hypothetical protein